MKWYALSLLVLLSTTVALAADHTITLTAEQELVAADLLADMNSQRAQQRDAQGTPLPALTLEQMLIANLASDLTNHKRNLEVLTNARLQLLRDLAATPAVQTAVLNKSVGTKKAWLQYKLSPE